MSKTPPNIVDRFGRVHDYLRISLTERCNLRCTYCMPEEGIQLRDRKEFMTSEELLIIAKEFVELGVKKIRLTGGEPLIKKNIENVISGLSQLGVELAITTNGILLDNFIDKLWDAGIRNINVSLDSLIEDRFNNISRRNYFDRIKDNIDLSIKKGFTIKINMVVMRNVNDDEILDFVEWSRKENVHVRFIEFMPFDGNKWNWESKVSQNEIMTQIENKYGKRNIYRLENEKNRISRNFKLVDSLGSFGIISSVTNPFCDTCNRIRLTADGKIKNCLFSQNETDLLTAVRKGDIGHIKDLIINSVENKAKSHGGIENFETLNEGDFENRSMVTIGG